MACYDEVKKYIYIINLPVTLKKAEIESYFIKEVGGVEECHLFSEVLCATVKFETQEHADIALIKVKMTKIFGEQAVAKQVFVFMSFIEEGILAEQQQLLKSPLAGLCLSLLNGEASIGAYIRQVAKLAAKEEIDEIKEKTDSLDLMMTDLTRKFSELEARADALTNWREALDFLRVEVERLRNALLPGGNNNAAAGNLN